MEEQKVKQVMAKIISGWHQRYHTNCFPDSVIKSTKNILKNHKFNDGYQRVNIKGHIKLIPMEDIILYGQKGKNHKPYKTSN